MADQADRNGVSRRKVLGGAAVVVGLGAGLASTSAYAKTSQADAKYQDKPSGSNMCGNCMQFEAPNMCKLVEGNIDKNGWCILYTPKG